MANSKLQGNKYPIPEEVHSYLSKVYSTIESGGRTSGYQRLKNLVDDGFVSYEELKRLKNFFDYNSIENNPEEFRITGGSVMKNWVDSTLEMERNISQRGKELRSDSGEVNQFKKGFTKDSTTLDRDYLINKIKQID